MKQLDTDIVIVGAGTAGLPAAVEAAERGARVIVFDKAATTGGMGNMAMGPFAVESRMQRIRKISLTCDEAFKIHMNFTRWRADARLVKAFIDKSADTIDWLEQLGVEFSDVQTHNQGFLLTWHVIKGEHHAAEAMMKLLTDRAKELGAEVMLQTPVKKLIKKDGRIAGVVAEDRNGEEITVNAKAVIIGTGGFSDNPAMIKKYTEYEWGKDIFSLRIPGLVGEGIRMAWEAGAGASEIHMQHSGGVSELFRPDVVTDAYFELPHTFNQPNLMVNLQGERITCEDVLITTPFGGNVVTTQKNRCAFMIFDEDTKKTYQETGLDFPAGFLIEDAVTKVTNLDAEIKRAIENGIESVWAVDSLEELAEKTGINLANLRQTVEEYNRACETGRDTLFHKNPKYLRPVKTPKFYVGRHSIGGLTTLGGIRINHRTEVLTKEYDIIPGLYAAGNDANSIYGDTYIFTLPGNTLGFALNTGRMAGENAAAYVKSVTK